MIELTTATERDLSRGLIVVRLTGVLTMSTRTRVVVAVAKCLAEAPTAVIVDLTGLLLAGPTERAILLWLQQMADRAPAVALLWCATPGSAGARLTDWNRNARIYPDLAAATGAALSDPNAARWMHSRLARTVDSAAEARMLVGDACLRWGLHHVLNDARLIVSELVTNAVDHTHSDEIVITARTSPPYLITTVRDRSPAPPIATLPRVVRNGDPAIADRGRGLHILDHYATAWGYVLTDDGGKAVWATLRTHPIQTR